MTESNNDKWMRLSHEAYEKLLNQDSWESLPLADRELAALWRLEADVNNGGYIQFYGNWDSNTLKYSLSGLTKMKAKRMFALTESALTILYKTQLKPGAGFNAIKDAISESDYEAVMDLSYEFMDYPDPLNDLGVAAYAPAK